jgi:hypothetical protein
VEKRQGIGVGNAIAGPCGAASPNSSPALAMTRIRSELGERVEAVLLDRAITTACQNRERLP